ncbi:hypothetical protein [Ferroplasma sp. Type II]|nr:hypothetical protein [Ferroplasma sp. Type II]
MEIQLMNNVASYTDAFNILSRNYQEHENTHDKALKGICICNNPE